MFGEVESGFGDLADDTKDVVGAGFIFKSVKEESNSDGNVKVDDDKE